MTAADPRVSVGLPVYNGQRYLSQTIESILAQRFADVEVVISDNASSDGTEEICRRYASQDSRIRYYRQPENVGVARNYNAAFGYARGRYFKWASSNDLCEPTFVGECVALLNRRPDVVLACPLTRYIYPDSVVEDEQRLELLDDSACVRFKTFLKSVRLNNVMNGLIRSDVLRRTVLHESYLGSDVVLMAEVALHGKFAAVPEFLFNRRMDRETATRFRSNAQVEDMFEPKRKRALLFQEWRANLAYVASVRRARPILSERACLYRFLLRRTLHNRGNLYADLVQAARQWLS